MQFKPRKRRHPPSVIIVSLIDVLMVVLIFLMVTTTFKHQPAVKIVLPHSNQARPGATQGNLLVTIAAKAPYLYLGSRAVSLEELRSDLKQTLDRNSHASVSINSDGHAPIQQLISVLDVVHEVNIPAQILTRRSTGP